MGNRRKSKRRSLNQEMKENTTEQNESQTYDYQAPLPDDNLRSPGETNHQSVIQGPRRSTRKKTRSRRRSQEQTDDEHNRKKSSVRKSARLKHKPFEFWRNERYIYERRKSGIGCYLPTVRKEKPISEGTPAEEYVYPIKKK